MAYTQKVSVITATTDSGSKTMEEFDEVATIKVVDGHMALSGADHRTIAIFAPREWESVKRHPKKD